MTVENVTFDLIMKKLVSDTRKPISHVDSKGFSLVELLVALTLFGFLVSGIITFVTAGLEVTEKTESRLAVHRDESQQESLLANALTYPVERLDT
jgi:prepilin-type N-terminal cleavage/methylation domain-containing protein